MIRRPPRSTLSSSSAASDVYKRQILLGGLYVYRFFCSTDERNCWLDRRVRKYLLDRIWWKASCTPWLWKTAATTAVGQRTPAAESPQHFLGRGAVWTMLHKPVRVLSVLPGTTELEKATTIALMVQHGWRKVRGGLWIKVDLPCLPPPIAKSYTVSYTHLTLPTKRIV